MNIEKPEIVLVTGNGFDLNLKLKTKYSDFAKSQEWQDMYKTCKSNSNQNSLLTFLNERKDTEQWFDIEQALLDYASVDCKYYSAYNVETDKKEYFALCEALGKYLKQHLLTRKHYIDDCWGAKLLQTLQYISDMRFYTFNFTSVKLIQEVANLHYPINYVSVHGSYDENSLIIGFEVQRFESIKPEYSFLIKSNSKHYQSVNMQKDMHEAREVIIFGHSMNMIDFGYFREYLQELASNLIAERRLTIITYDDNSRECLLNNIRKAGVNVQNLYGYGNLEILMSKKGINGQEKKFDELIERIYHYKTL